MELIGVDEKSENEVMTILKQFKDTNVASKSFDLSLDNRKKVWRDLFAAVNKNQNSDLQFDGLNCARILSRERAGLNEAITEDIVESLMRFGNIETTGDDTDDRVTTEALKVLSNLLHQSPVVQSYCTNNGFLSKLLNKIRSYSRDLSEDGGYEAKIFDFRLLFLFTALCPEQRDIARHNHDAVETLIKVLDTAAESSELDSGSADVVCEDLKVLFNLTVNSGQEDTGELMKVAASVKNIVRMVVSDEDVRMKVISNVINAVTNFDGKEEPLIALLKPTDIQNPRDEDKVHQDVVVNVLDCFLDYLELK